MRPKCAIFISKKRAKVKWRMRWEKVREIIISYERWHVHRENKISAKGNRTRINKFTFFYGVENIAMRANKKKMIANKSKTVRRNERWTAKNQFKSWIEKKSKFSRYRDACGWFCCPVFSFASFPLDFDNLCAIFVLPFLRLFSFLFLRNNSFFSRSRWNQLMPNTNWTTHHLFIYRIILMPCVNVTIVAVRCDVVWWCTATFSWWRILSFLSLVAQAVETTNFSWSIFVYLLVYMWATAAASFCFFFCFYFHVKIIVDSFLVFVDFPCRIS